MKLSTRGTLGLAAVAAIALSTTVSGAALASRGADDAVPTPSATSTASPVDDKGGLTDRDLRFEPGDDRVPNGVSPSALPSSPASPSAKPSASPSAEHHRAGTHRGHGADDPAGHDAGDDQGRHGGKASDDAAGHDAGDDHGRHGGHGSDDAAGHDAGDDHGRHGGHGSDD